MSLHLERAIDKLKSRLLDLGARVEGDLRRAVMSVEERSEERAQEVFLRAHEIDEMEVDIEEECLKTLALYHPVAVDLRYIVAILKINNDLERIGDVIVNIAERATFLAARSPLDGFDFSEMAEKTQIMLRRSLDALVGLDIALAQRVRASDDEVDDINRDFYRLVQDAILRRPEDLEALIHVLGVSRHLERIADLATNIAEDVIYTASGEIARHRPEDFRPGDMT